MVQIRVGDIYLDLYEFDPPKLNFAIEDITDTSARSEFSQTFRIPATSNNSEFFQTAFEINGFDFDITQKIDAELMVNGVLFRQGELRLNNIFITRENEQIDYEVIFFSTTRSLATSIGEGTLNELNLSALDHSMSTANIVASWQAFPESTGYTAGLQDGNVLYPLIDHGNTYDDNGEPEQGEISITSGTGRYPFTNSSSTNRLERERFKPMVRAKYIWDAIFNEAGFTYTSNFIESGSTFQKLYVGAFGNEASIYTFAGQNTGAAKGVILAGNSGGEINLDDVLIDYGNNFSGGRYISPLLGTYAVQYSMNGSVFVDPDSDVTITLTLKKAPNTTIDSASVEVTNQDPINGQNLPFSVSDFVSTGLLASDELFLEFSTAPTTDINQSEAIMSIQDAPGDMSMSALLPDNYKKIDFIRDIITKFRLVLAPDKNNSSNFIIEPWSTFIASGDLFDWTDKLDVSKDFKITPLFYTQKSKVIFTDTEGGDEYNVLYKDEFEEVFGTLNVISNNDLINGERKIETKIQPTIVTQIRGALEANGGYNNCIIPQLNKFEATDGLTQHQPVVSVDRLAFYNGIKDVTNDGYSNNTPWYLEADGGGTVNYYDYPMVSSYSDFPVSASTLDLNWQRETGYIKFDKQDANVGSSVYDTYWSQYIESLYDKWARRVTAYFVLNSQDLQDFSYDDVIFVKDAYYYVEKIYDVPLGEKASVKVDLIKILDAAQVPDPTSAPLPPPSPTPTPAPTPSPILLDPDAEAFLEDVVAAGGTVDSTMSGATDTFYKALKTNNIWSKMILFYPLIGGTAAAHSIQGIRSSGTTYDLTMVGGMTHGVSGATGNGTNSGMRTRYLANNLPTTRGQGMYIVNGTARAQYQMGGGNGTYNMQIISYGTGSGYIGFGSFKTYNPTTVGDRLSGNIVATINGSNQVNAYKNGTQVITNSTGSNVRGSLELSLLCDNRLTSPSFSTTESADSTMAFAWYSELLTDSEMRTLSQLINTYQTSLGRNIH